MPRRNVKIVVKRSTSASSRRSSRARTPAPGRRQRKKVKIVTTTRTRSRPRANSRPRIVVRNVNSGGQARLQSMREAYELGAKQAGRRSLGQVRGTAQRIGSVPYADYHAGHSMVAGLTPTGVPARAGPGVQVQRALTTRGTAFLNVTIPPMNTLMFFSQPWAGVGAGYYAVQPTNLANSAATYPAGTGPITADNYNLSDGNVSGFNGIHTLATSFDVTSTTWTVVPYTADPFRLPNLYGGGINYVGFNNSTTAVPATGYGYPVSVPTAAGSGPTVVGSPWNTFGQYNGGFLKATVEVPQLGQANTYPVGASDNLQMYGTTMPGVSTNNGDITDSITLREGPLVSYATAPWTQNNGINYPTVETLDVGVRANYRPTLQMGGSNSASLNYAQQLPNQYGETWTRLGSSAPADFQHIGQSYTDGLFGTVNYQGRGAGPAPDQPSGNVPVSQPVFAWLSAEARPCGAEVYAMNSTASLLRPGNLAIMSNGLFMVDNVSSTSTCSVELQISHEFNVSVGPTSPQYPLSHPVRKHDLPSNAAVGGYWDVSANAEKALRRAVAKCLQNYGPEYGQPPMNPLICNAVLNATVAPPNRMINGYVPTSTVGDPTTGRTTSNGNIAVTGVSDIQRIATAFGANILSNAGNYASNAIGQKVGGYVVNKAASALGMANLLPSTPAMQGLGLIQSRSPQMLLQNVGDDLEDDVEDLDPL